MIRERAMHKRNAVCIVSLLLAVMIFSGGCTAPAAPSATQTIPAPVPGTTPAPVATPSPRATPPGPAATATLQARDPILGSWTNGLVFHADGTVGSGGNTTWKANRYQNYSYFVITDVPSAGSANQRNVTSTEWIYNPYSDKIYLRGSSESFGRQAAAPESSPGVPVTETAAPATPVPTTCPPAATTAVNTTVTTAATTTVTTRTAVPTTRATVVTTIVIPTIRPLVTTATTRPATSETTAVIYLPSEDGTGTLLIRTGGVGNDVTISVSREDDSSGILRIPILPNGNSDIVSLPVGSYIASLPDKNGGDPEEHVFSINTDSNTVITFSAYSYRASSGGGCGK